MKSLSSNSVNARGKNSPESIKQIRPSQMHQAVQLDLHS